MGSAPQVAVLLAACAQFVLCSPSHEITSVIASDSASPPISGIAHVAIRVRDLSASRAFYHQLGFEEAFSLDKGGTPTEAFLKVNDTQFIELYPSREAGQRAGFLHVCFESRDLAALNEFYEKRGLNPTPVRRAGAGNLLFTMRGPEQQNIEFTQYMPGSKHTLDIGKHLVAGRISDQIIGIGIPTNRVGDTSEFYADQMKFPRIGQQKDIEVYGIPGTSEQQIEISLKTKSSHLRLILGIKDVKRAAKQLKESDIAAWGKAGLFMHDPDGNLIQLRPLPAGSLSAP